jgi:hypothetical protein
MRERVLDGWMECKTMMNHLNDTRSIPNTTVGSIDVAEPETLSTLHSPLSTLHPTTISCGDTTTTQVTRSATS